jgi:hypothetical protein
MRKHFISGIVAFGCFALLASLANAGPDVNLNGKLYRADLVQAMDECAAAVTNVDGVGACPESNANTDGSHFRLGRIQIKANQNDRQVMTIIKSSSANPTAALAGKILHTVIMLRVTRTSSAPLVTWVDQVLDCPDFAVPSNGNAVQKVSLTNCGLPAALAENSTNKEVIAVQVVDSGSGKPLAVPGIRRR